MPHVRIRLAQSLTGIALCLLLQACSNATPRPAASPRSAAGPAASSAVLGGATAAPPGSPAVSVPSVTSTAFREGAALPARYSCDGQGVSPPLAWSGFPAGTAAYVLIVDDPDGPSGLFTHWLVLNLPATTTALPEGVPTGGPVAGTGVQATNGARRPGYQPACPPPGPAHRYQFTVYALNAPLQVGSSATRADVDAALQGHILAQGRLTGLYQRAARTPSPTPAR